TFATLMVVPSIFALVIGRRVAHSPSVYPLDPQSSHYDPHASERVEPAHKDVKASEDFAAWDRKSALRPQAANTQPAPEPSSGGAAPAPDAPPAATESPSVPQHRDSEQSP